MSDNEKGRPGGDGPSENSSGYTDENTSDGQELPISQAPADICILEDCPDVIPDGGFLCPRHEGRDLELCLSSASCTGKRVNANYCQEHTPEADDAFWTARPVLAHLRAYARAYRTAPWAVFGATVARVVAATPPTLALPGFIGGGPGSLNLLLALTGPSGAGKGASIRTSKTGFVIPEEAYETKLGSGQGIAHVYVQLVKDAETKVVSAQQTRDRALFVNSEIDNITAHASQTAATLMSELRSAWSGETLGQYYVDQSKRMIVPDNAYRLCLLVGVQPARARGIMEDAAGGTPQRFLWFSVMDPAMPEVAPPAPDKTWVWKCPVAGPDPYPGPLLEDPDGKPAIQTMRVCETARKDIDADFMARVRPENGAHELDAHAMLSRLKVAAALALLDERLEVTEEDWELSGMVMARSKATRDMVANVLGAEITEAAKAKRREAGLTAQTVDSAVHVAKVDKATKRALTVLGKAPGEWMSASDLRRDAGSAYRDHIAEALDVLAKAKRVESEPSDKGVKWRLRSQ